MAFTAVVFIFELILDYRQFTKFDEAKKVPKELEGIIDQETFDKANACTFWHISMSLTSCLA